MKQIMVIMLAGFISSAYAADIYVSLTGDGSDGLSWSTAFTNVQSAIDNATAGDAIRVQGGTYLLSQDIVWANKNNLSVLGGYEGTGTPGASNPVQWPTVLERQPGSICRILSITNVVGATLSGVTLTGGIASNVVASAHSMGGGLYVLKASAVTVSFCTITNNAVAQYTTSNSRYAYGGGVCVEASSVTIVDSLIAGNTAESKASGVYCASYGGGIAALTSSTVILSNSVVRGNGSLRGTNGSYPGAGGIYSDSETFRIENSLVYGNNASDLNFQKFTGRGHGLYGNSFTVRNSTIAFNMGEGLYQNSSTSSKKSTFTDCILWGNGNDIAGSAANVTLDHCNTGLFDGDTGTGCIHADPQFDRGFYLAAGSPCVDAGSQTAANAGMNARTTRADGTADIGIVDLGYHATGGTGDATVDLYVTASGSDATGDGSASNPYRSITKALTELPDWGTVHIGSGVYTAASGETFPFVLNNRIGLSFIGAGAGATVLDNARTEGHRILEISNSLNVAFSELTLARACATETNSISIYGGAVRIVYGGGIRFSDCTISDSIAWSRKISGYGVNAYGGGIASCGASLLLERCTIQDNDLSNRTATAYGTGGRGGGVAVIGGLATLVNCAIVGNRTSSSAKNGIGMGAGVYNNRGTTWIYDSLIVSNSAYVPEWDRAGAGDGVFNGGNDTFSYLVMESCTMADNVNVTNVSGFYNEASNYTTDSKLLNCIVVGHTDDIYNGKTIQVSTSCVSTVDTFWTDGVNGCQLWNTTDPLFKQRASGNYRLADNAVVKNVGNNRYWMGDILDMGGNPRVAYGVVDMGCYENTPPSGTVLSIR